MTPGNLAIPSVSRQIVLAKRPEGMPKESDFSMVEAPLPQLGAGQVLIRALYLSVDPYVRGRLTGNSSYVKGIQPGEVITSGVVGQVVESGDPRLAAGDIVEGILGWQEYDVAQTKNLRKVDPAAAPISTALYVLGMPGDGLLRAAGDLPAAGGRNRSGLGRRRSGWLPGGANRENQAMPRHRRRRQRPGDRIPDRELGFDGAFNYKESSDYYGSLKELCPNGIDIYFDNVGGNTTDAAVRLLNTRARIGVCGQISQYNLEEPQMVSLAGTIDRQAGPGRGLSGHSIRRPL